MKLMKRLLLMVLGLLPLARLQAANTPAPVTATVKVGGLSIRESDLIITPKKEYVHVLWDVFPSASILAARATEEKVGLKALRQRLAQDMVRNVVLPRHPGSTHFKVNIVEFPDRDQYGAPVWARVRKLDRLEWVLDAQGALAQMAGR